MNVFRKKRKINYNASLKEKNRLGICIKIIGCFQKEKERYDSMMIKIKSLKIIMRFLII